MMSSKKSFSDRVKEAKAKAEGKKNSTIVDYFIQHNDPNNEDQAFYINIRTRESLWVLPDDVDSSAVKFIGHESESGAIFYESVETGDFHK